MKVKNIHTNNALIEYPIRFKKQLIFMFKNEQKGKKGLSE